MSYSRRQLYAFGEPLGDGATRREVGGKTVYGSGGGGGGGGDQKQTTVTDIPEWAKPYAKETLGKTAALTNAPYQTYGGERVAQFTPLQQQAFGQAGQQQVAGQIGQATGIAGLAAQQGLNAGNYQAGSFDPMSVQAPSLQQFQMGPAMQVGSQQVGTQGIQAAQTGFNPMLERFQMGPAQTVSSRDVGTQGIDAAQTGFRPDLQQFQMEGPQSFTQAGTAEQFMNPYMQNVVGIQQREAQRQADIAGTQRGAEAVRAGAFGGSRQAIMEAEAQRNLSQQMGDIQATGSQATFQQAQQQFNQEQQARAQAQQANLQARLGVQELGTQAGLQTSLANLSNEQQSRVQSEANRLQSQGMNQEAALRSALANQQAGLTVSQENLRAAMGTQELGTQAGLQTSLANLSNEQQARVQSEANRLQSQGMNQDAALRSALANQQAGLTVGQQNLAAQLGIQQLGTGQSMEAQRANQQARLDAQRAFEQSRQFGAELGLRGGAQALQGAQTLGQLGGQQFGQQMDITNQQFGMGQQQRAATQDILSQQYQDFLNQQRAPYDQLSFMNSMIRGTPMGQTTTQYAPPPSQFSQLAGLATAGAGAYGAYQGNKAAGGEVKSYATGGIASLNQPEMAAMAGGMSDEQLQQTEGLPSITELARMTLAAEAQQRAQMRQQATAQQAMMQQQPQTTVAEEQMAALGGIGDLPAPNLENLGEGMAGGGIIAFQTGGPIRLPAGTPPQEVERVRMENPGQEVMVETAGLGALPLYTMPTGMTPEMAAASGVPTGVQEIMRQRRTLVGETGQQGIRAAEANLANTERDIKEMGPIGAERDKRNLAQEKNLEGAEGKNFNMALIQAGLAIMAGNSANAFENIGKGAMVGTEAYTKGMERIQSRKEKLDESIARLDELRFSTTKADKAEVRSAMNGVNTAKTALGNAMAGVLGEEGKIAADAYASQETRKATYASANKPTDQRNFVNDFVAAARAEGDTTTPDSVLRKKGALEYLSTVGMSGARANIAADVAETTAARAQADLTAKATQYVDDQIGAGGPKFTEYRRLQKADRDNGTETAKAFERRLYDDFIQSATPRTAAPAAAAGAGAGTAQSPLPMPANAASARVGMIYNTARGPARWDGSSFIPVQ